MKKYSIQILKDNYIHTECIGFDIYDAVETFCKEGEYDFTEGEYTVYVTDKDNITTALKVRAYPTYRYEVSDK